jgi:hypothetical protein
MRQKTEKGRKTTSTERERQRVGDHLEGGAARDAGMFHGMRLTVVAGETQTVK